MQKPRDIIEGLLRKEPVERMGYYDSPWGDAVTKWVEEEGYPKNAEGKPVDVTDFFGFDMSCVGGWFDIMPMRGHEELLAETDEWTVKRNGAGAAFKYWKNKSGTPEHVDFLMTSRQIWERDYRHHLLQADRQRLKIEDAKNALKKRREQGIWAFYGSVFIWETMRASLGDVCMYESLVLDQDWIHDFNRVYTDFFKTHYKILIEEAGKPDGIWIYEDLGYNKGLFCSPAVLEELIFPYFEELVDFFHGYDLPVLLHSCGNVTEAVPMVVSAGFDALNPMEAKAGCDVVGWARKYGDKMAFVGGMDALIFESGDRARIKAEVIRIMSEMKKCGARYVFGSDHSISPNVRLDDFKYAREVYRECMIY